MLILKALIGRDGLQGSEESRIRGQKASKQEMGAEHNQRERRCSLCTGHTHQRPLIIVHYALIQSQDCLFGTFLYQIQD